MSPHSHDGQGGLKSTARSDESRDLVNFVGAAAPPGYPPRMSDDLRAHVWSGAVAGTQSGGAVVIVEGNRISANGALGRG